MNSNDVINKLKQNGWILVRPKGSHHVFKNSALGLTVVIPHPRKDLPIGTLRAIAKQAQIKI